MKTRRNRNVAAARPSSTLKAWGTLPVCQGVTVLLVLCGLMASCTTFPGVSFPDVFGTEPPEPVGACCLIGGNCIVVTQDDCVQQLGNYLGDGFPCGLGPCPG